MTTYVNIVPVGL